MTIRISGLNPHETLIIHKNRKKPFQCKKERSKARKKDCRSAGQDGEVEKKVAGLVDISNHLNQLKASVSGYSYSFPIPAIDSRGPDIANGNGVAIVVYRQSSCDYLGLENGSSYIVGEWIGGNILMKR